jgi:hypothetical protein
VGTGGIRDLEELAHTCNKVIGYTDLSQIVQAERAMKRTAPGTSSASAGPTQPHPRPCLDEAAITAALDEQEQSGLPAAQMHGRR